ncbi:hypothetical protein BTO04_09855 [Polaribacter sp. SA4-10]|uniref:DUF6168 family protein n=1 Tax=Polaribacter sp. SA4-10 TaxID=754397 RepID=UPI000B3C86AA|nr:DUF6168 family protein [Polaribacter sp. SA4-10]ARV06970.1 hypothetical protein BTO04_09855 [Polaribacter sp. SA4-10]
MNKDIFTYIIVFVVLFLIVFYSHQTFLSCKEITLGFSLEKIYLFHAFFSALVCINLRVVSTVDKLFTQLGFIYLASLVIKLVLFCIFFYKSILTIETFTFSEKISLLIPIFIFLLTEVVFVAKTLNRSNKKQF